MIFINKEKSDNTINSMRCDYMEEKEIKEINYAMVEETRPPIYTAMKYWGKKPHNIWRKYIETYTPKNGICLDPFVGSGMTAFESVKAGRKVIAFDLNPLSTFLIEVLASDFDKDVFKDAAEDIIDTIKMDKTYQKYFSTECRKCGYADADAQSFKWNENKMYEIAIVCPQCKTNILKINPDATKTRLRKLWYVTEPDKKDKAKAKKMDTIKINTWYPTKKFHSSMDMQPSFIRDIGGNRFYNIWTRRNLYVISKIFDEIMKNKDDKLKKQLLYGFIQTIHLCTKMCVPRRLTRPFSTSWGRSAYLCAKRQMEMNPLYVFQSACFEKQSVTSSLSSVRGYLGKKPKLLYVDKSNKSNRSKNFDIKYGIVDINTIDDYVDKKSISFVITDPPYGGLVQYLDLSSLFLVWLEKYDIRYKANYTAEITINKVQDTDTYQRKFLNGIKNLFEVLKDDGKIVFTFHNNDVKIWNAFLNAMPLSGFRPEKVIHQQNKRTGESNVANPYGTSASDLYIRYIKDPVTNLKTDEEKFEHFVVKKTIYLIAQRNEPTPFYILFGGLLVEIAEAGFDLEDFNQNIETILKKHVGTIFKLTVNTATKAGDFWWFTDPEEYIKYPNRLLADRVEETIMAILRQKVSVTFDEVKEKIFVKYPNGLLPDTRTIIKDTLEKYADKSGGRWIYKSSVEKEIKKHNKMIYNMVQIGKKLGYKTFIGKREQSEDYKGQKLASYADLTRLNLKGYDKIKRSRIEMIDVVWLDNNKIEYIIEVENKTDFTSGIQRGSNVEEEIPKLMVIPNDREKELLNIKDPFFINGFKNHNWNYITYSDVKKLISLRNINKLDIEMYCRAED